MGEKIDLDEDDIVEFDSGVYLTMGCEQDEAKKIVKQIQVNQEKLEKMGEYIVRRDEEEKGSHPDWSNLREIFEEK